MFVYAGTKAAQLNWALSPARQFGGQGVTVNNLAPGAILTARNRDQMAVEGEALDNASRPGALAGRTIWSVLRCCCAPTLAVTSMGSISSWMADARRFDDRSGAPNYPYRRARVPHDSGRYPPSTIYSNERLLIPVGHSKAAVPDSVSLRS